MKEMMVSICCMAYNHEKYIADALDGFLRQKTDFQYEVIVHDDASLDGTTEIIQTYEADFPEIIKPIYQKVNQYSQRVWITKEIMYPNAKGKYIALCEGDDYWIDPEKLQKQVDYMEAHPECTLCFTNGQCEIEGEIKGRVIPFSPVNKKVYKTGDTDYDMGEMARLDYVPTASLLFRRSDIMQVPDLPKSVFRGDTYIRLYLTSLGYAHCIDEDTCVYRYGVPNSATTTWTKDPQKRIAFNWRFIALMDKMDEITLGKYSKSIHYMKRQKEYENYFLQQQYTLLRKPEVHQFYIAQGFLVYLKYVIHAYFPAGFRFLQKLKCKLRNKGK